MRNLIAIVSVISLLALASTAILYAQTERVSSELLVSRALDRASAYALAAKSAPCDDGVLVRLAEQMQDDFVLNASVYTEVGACLGPTASCREDTTGLHQTLDSLNGRQELVAGPGPSIHGKQTLDVWYGLRTGSGATEPGPGPRTNTQRVLRLVVDTASGRVLPLASLVHAGIIAGLLVLLVALTARQARAIAREQAMHNTLEEQRRFAELGRMASVLAHEIRNPLGAIKGFAQYAREQLKGSGPLYEDMQTIVVESGRLERLVRSLLSYAKPTNLNVGPHDLRAVVQRAARMTEHTAAEAGQTLCLELGDIPVVAIIDPDEMSQALLNLLINGVEAIDAPGGQVRVTTQALDDTVSIDVSDTGAGMPEELRQRGFEPFVTGKASGTGLGLAVVARIVKAHGGSIVISDGDTGGTRFSICLPRHAKRDTMK